MGLVLGLLVVLDSVVINITQHSREGQAYMTVSPSMFVVVTVPNHDDDLGKA